MLKKSPKSRHAEACSEGWIFHILRVSRKANRMTATISSQSYFWVVIGGTMNYSFTANHVKAGLVSRHLRINTSSFTVQGIGILVNRQSKFIIPMALKLNLQSRDVTNVFEYWTPKVDVQCGGHRRERGSGDIQPFAWSNIAPPPFQHVTTPAFGCCRASQILGKNKLDNLECSSARPENHSRSHNLRYGKV